MPKTPIATSEPDVWAALQLDLEPNGQSPEEMAPIDRDFVRSLIVQAESRLGRFLGVSFYSTYSSGMPAELQAAVNLDVATHYFNRLNPELPDAWGALIEPYRQWGFGG